MSFRTRLTTFFIVIVIVPMIAVGFLAFRLIGDSASGKTAARANGLATAAASGYAAAQARARADAEALARAAVRMPSAQLQQHLTALATRAALSRLVLRRGGAVLLDVGDRTAIAPGVAQFTRGTSVFTVTVSDTQAGDYAATLTGPGAAVVIRQAGRTLASTAPGPAPRPLPRSADVTIGDARYHALTNRFVGFGPARVRVTVLSDLAVTTTSVGKSRLLAAVFIAGFLLLAFGFSVLASRGLENQVARFLQAARRLAGGDFSSPVPVEGNDEFAALATEFNNMSAELARRLDELTEERRRLRESIRRAGETFASNLDRPALLGLALKTAVDAVEGDRGRLSIRATEDGPLSENVREHRLDGIEESVLEAERIALRTRQLGEATAGDVSIASMPLGPFTPEGRPHGLLTVGRAGRPFTDDDRDMLRSLVGQATLALENVELHEEVARQAVTDELTGLSNHGRFQELLGGEMEQVRRYHYVVGLIMLDIDNFKRVNDTYGHPQGDVVLKYVARVLRDNSRDADSPARYGGEEMALILPHTDLDGSYAIAERVREAIEALRIPRLDGEGFIRITASLGVGVTSTGDKEPLIAETDAALYQAKRTGKNRTVRARVPTANVSGGE
jgi:diguanylate cyclase (GGDEF)-like protein